MTRLVWEAGFDVEAEDEDGQNDISATTQQEHIHPDESNHGSDFGKNKRFTVDLDSQLDLLDQWAAEPSGAARKTLMREASEKAKIAAQELADIEAAIKIKETEEARKVRAAERKKAQEEFHSRLMSVSRRPPSKAPMMHLVDSPRGSDGKRPEGEAQAKLASGINVRPPKELCGVTSTAKMVAAGVGFASTAVCSTNDWRRLFRQFARDPPSHAGPSHCPIGWVDFVPAMRFLGRQAGLPTSYGREEVLADLYEAALEEDAADKTGHLLSGKFAAFMQHWLKKHAKTRLGMVEREQNVKMAENLSQLPHRTIRCNKGISAARKQRHGSRSSHKHRHVTPGMNVRAPPRVALQVAEVCMALLSVYTLREWAEMFRQYDRTRPRHLSLPELLRAIAASPTQDGVRGTELEESRIKEWFIAVRNTTRSKHTDDPLQMGLISAAEFKRFVENGMHTFMAVSRLENRTRAADGVAPFSGRAGLESLSNKELRQLARNGGATSEQLDGAADDDDPRQSLITLVLELQAVVNEHSRHKTLREKIHQQTELESLTNKELRARARIEGATEEQLENAADSDEPRDALIHLVSKQMHTEASAKGHMTPEDLSRGKNHQKQLTLPSVSGRVSAPPLKPSHHLDRSAVTTQSQRAASVPLPELPKSSRLNAPTRSYQRSRRRKFEKNALDAAAERTRIRNLQLQQETAARALAEADRMRMQFDEPDEVSSEDEGPGTHESLIEADKSSSKSMGASSRLLPKKKLAPVPIHLNADKNWSGKGAGRNQNRSVKLDPEHSPGKGIGISYHPQDLDGGFDGEAAVLIRLDKEKQKRREATVLAADIEEHIEEDCKKSDAVVERIELEKQKQKRRKEGAATINVQEETIEVPADAVAARVAKEVRTDCEARPLSEMPYLDPDFRALDDNTELRPFSKSQSAQSDSVVSKLNKKKKKRPAGFGPVVFNKSDTTLQNAEVSTELLTAVVHPLHSDDY
eukprot:SAG31_NODE_289_length_18388_cov_7.110504_10_plen_979_part_00